MKYTHKHSKLSYFTLILFTGVMLLFLVLYPDISSKAAGNSIKLCLTTVIPSLFPFLVLSSLITSSNLADHLSKFASKIISPVFKLPGAACVPLIFGFIGGYPTGAKMTASLYADGSITKNDAERLLAFSNNCGPAFIIGVVGGGIFKSGKIGILLTLIHIMSALIVGIIFRNRKESTVNSPLLSKTPSSSLSVLLTNAVIGSVGTCLNICGFIIFFSVIIELLNSFGVISFLSSAVYSLFGKASFNAFKAVSYGTVELTAGISEIRSILNLNTALVISSFILAWGGVSVHFQTMSVLSKTDLSLKQYVLGKLLHGVLSALLTRIFLLLFPNIQDSAEVFSGGASFTTAFEVYPAIFILSFTIICFVGFFAAYAFLKKRQ